MLEGYFRHGSVENVCLCLWWQSMFPSLLQTNTDNHCMRLRGSLFGFNPLKTQNHESLNGLRGLYGHTSWWLCSQYTEIVFHSLVLTYSLTLHMKQSSLLSIVSLIILITCLSFSLLSLSRAHMHVCAALSFCLSPADWKITWTSAPAPYLLPIGILLSAHSRQPNLAALGQGCQVLFRFDSKKKKTLYCLHIAEIDW